MSKKMRPCEICGEPIDPERIEVLPETRLCSEHARMIAKHGGEFIVTGTQSSLGKGGSLKKTARRLRCSRVVRRGPGPRRANLDNRRMDALRSCDLTKPRPASSSGLCIRLGRPRETFGVQRTLTTAPHCLQDAALTHLLPDSQSACAPRPL